MGRLGLPKSVAAAILSLASDDSGYTTAFQDGITRHISRMTNAVRSDAGAAQSILDV